MQQDAARGGHQPSLDRHAAPLPQEEGSLRLSPRERALVGPELQGFVAQMPPGAARDGYQALLDALDAGEVVGPHLGRLEAFLELALSTGRIRERHGQHGEDEVRRVFARTPRGQAQTASVNEVTKALSGLIDQPLRNLQLTTTRPGSYRLIIESDQLRVSLALAPAGAYVESVEVTV